MDGDAQGADATEMRAMPARRDGPKDGLEEELEECERRATRGDDGESYLEMASDGTFRMGVTVRAGPGGSLQYVMEVLMCVLGRGRALDVPGLEEAIRMTRLLEGRGYVQVHQDGGWVCWERALARADVQREGKAIERLVDGTMREDDEVQDVVSNGVD